MSSPSLHSSHVNIDLEYISATSDSFWERLNLLLDALGACPPGKGRKMWIAAAAGISRPAVQGWVEGRKPRKANIEQLCNYLMERHELPASHLQLEQFLISPTPEINVLAEMDSAGMPGHIQALIYIAVNNAMEQLTISPIKPENEKIWAVVALRVARFYTLRQSKDEEVNSMALDRVALAYLTLVIEGAI